MRTKKEFPFLIATTLLLTFLAYFFQSDYKIVWWEAIVLLIAFGLYMYLMITSDKDMTEEDIPFVDIKKATILLIINLLYRNILLLSFISFLKV